MRLLLAGLLSGREAGKRSDRKLREARAADAVGSKGGTERRRSLKGEGEAKRLALNFLEGRTWTTKKSLGTDAFAASWT